MTVIVISDDDDETPAGQINSVVPESRKTGKMGQQYAFRANPMGRPKYGERGVDVSTRLPDDVRHRENLPVNQVPEIQSQSSLKALSVLPGTATGSDASVAHLNAPDIDMNNVDLQGPNGTTHMPAIYPVPFDAPNRMFRSDVPAHLLPLLDHILCYFDRYRLEPFIGDILDVLHMLTQTGIAPGYFIQDGIAALSQLAREANLPESTRGVVHLRSLQFAKNDLQRFNTKVRGHRLWQESLEDEHKQLVKVATEQLGFRVDMAYTGQTDRTLARRELDAWSACALGKIYQDVILSLPGSYRMVAIIDISSRSARFGDMAELTAQAIVGFDRALNKLFWAKSHRFKIAKELSELCSKRSPPTERSVNDLPIVLDDVGVSNGYIDRNLRSPTVQALSDLRSRVGGGLTFTVVNLLRGKGSNDLARLAPGDAASQIAYLQTRPYAIFGGVRAMQAICDLRVLYNAGTEQFLEYGLDVHSGAFVEAQWASSGQQFIFCCTPHPGAGAHAPYSTTQLWNWDQTTAAIVIGYEVIHGGTQSAGIIEVAQKWLRSTKQERAILNKNELQSLHSQEQWKWIEEHVIKRRPADFLCWIDEMRPQPAGSGPLRQAGKKGITTWSGFVRRDDKDRQTRVSASLNNPKWSVKQINVGEWIEYHYTADGLVLLGPEPNDIRSRIPWQDLVDSAGGWPFLYAAIVYNSVSIDRIQSLLEDPERDMTGQQVFENRVPEALRPTVLELVAGRIDFTYYAPRWRLMAREDDQYQAYSTTSLDCNGAIRWFRNVGDGAIAPFFLLTKQGVQAGERLRPVFEDGNLFFVNEAGDNRAKTSILGLWIQGGRNRLLVDVALLMGLVDPHSLPFIDELEDDASMSELFVLRVPQEDTRHKIIDLFKKRLNMTNVDLNLFNSNSRYVDPLHDIPAAYRAVASYQWTRSSVSQCKAFQFSIGGLRGRAGNGDRLRLVITRKRAQLLRENKTEAWGSDITELWSGGKKLPVIPLLGLVLGILTLEDLTAKQSITSLVAGQGRR
ncbi:hypothetical protein R3P38DRAFT_742736 [Favolaschia claudopus]|uniref:Uncharacterized protein n=1 Tax=Favolaschia claudopus TaxID=2862362 RepID=A0AAW0C868_9AGAR